MQIRVAGLTRESVVDGPGLRFVVFAQGCAHNCIGCQNPETHAFDGGKLMDTAEILQEIQRGKYLRGVTFSGGDPFYQAAGFAELAQLCRAQGFDIVTYTGFTFEQIMDAHDPAQLELLRATDLLIDGPFILAQKDLSLPFRGSANQRIIDVQKSLAANAVILYTLREE